MLSRGRSTLLPVAAQSRQRLVERPRFRDSVEHPIANTQFSAFVVGSSPSPVTTTHCDAPSFLAVLVMQTMSLNQPRSGPKQ